MKSLRITTRSTSGRFRRAGRAFTDKPTEIPVEDLTEAEVKALNAEPELVVEEIETEAAPDGGQGKQDPKGGKPDESEGDKPDGSDKPTGEAPAKKAAKKAAAKSK